MIAPHLQISPNNLNKYTTMMFEDIFNDDICLATSILLLKGDETRTKIEKEKENIFSITMSLPGLDASNISVKINGTSIMVINKEASPILIYDGISFSKKIKKIISNIIKNGILILVIEVE